MQLTHIQTRNQELSMTFYRREIYRVIGSNTGKIKDIENEVKLISPHICYGLII